MTSETFNKAIADRIDQCTNVLITKAAEYATEDRLHNFKVAAEMQGCTPIKALAGMMAKHTVSIYDLVNDVEKGKNISLELWDEKIGDHINYLLLLHALLREG